MERVPFAAGDVRWVFPEAADAQRLRSRLSAIADRMAALANDLGTRAAGGGLEFQRLPLTDVIADVSGWVEVDGVVFRRPSRSTTIPTRPSAPWSAMPAG